jgi:hypothetical protein
VSTEPVWTHDGALFDYDFFNQRSWPQTFSSEMVDTRASDQCVPNARGVWTTAVSGVLPRSSSYLEVEPSRTNSVQNNSIQGAVAGSPGTTPTNWTVTSSAHGLTRAVIGIGTEKGIDYLDIRYFGTPTSTLFPSIYPESLSLITSANGQTWTGSFFLGAVAAVTGLTSIVASVGDSPGGGATNSSAINLTSTLTRYSATRTISDGSNDTVWTRLVLTVTNGVPVDFTLRIGWPQLERGSSVTSPIRTTDIAVTRAANAIKLQRTGVGRVVFTFDDDSTQTVSNIDTGSQYMVPTNLNRPLIKRMTGYSS